MREKKETKNNKLHNLLLFTSLFLGDFVIDPLIF
jgi:hypothetical protein